MGVMMVMLMMVAMLMMAVMMRKGQTVQAQARGAAAVGEERLVLRSLHAVRGACVCAGALLGECGVQASERSKAGMLDRQGQTLKEGEGGRVSATSSHVYMGEWVSE